MQALTTGSAIVALLGMFTPERAQAGAGAAVLQLQAISKETPDGCLGVPELDGHVAEEIKQLTGRTIRQSPTAPGNPTLTAVAPFQVFGGYIEPLDNDGWRARLWLKDAGKSQVAVRDAYYPNLDRLNAELPQDAAALILLPDWSRVASALPQYCYAPGKSPYPEDACDAFLPPPSCGVPFDCTQRNQAPRCPVGPTCGVAGKPACAPAQALCRVKSWQFGSGIAALVAGGVVVTIGGLLQTTEADGPPPVSIASYVVGGSLLGTGTGLLMHWALHAKKVPCKKPD